MISRYDVSQVRKLKRIQWTGKDKTPIKLPTAIERSILIIFAES